jgi:hypothetical protein
MPSHEATVGENLSLTRQVAEEKTHSHQAPRGEILWRGTADWIGEDEVD